MSRAKKTRIAKKRSALGLYRRIGELLNSPGRGKLRETLPNNHASGSAETPDVQPKRRTK